MLLVSILGLYIVGVFMIPILMFIFDEKIKYLWIRHLLQLGFLLGLVNGFMAIWVLGGNDDASFLNKFAVFTCFATIIYIAFFSLLFWKTEKEKQRNGRLTSMAFLLITSVFGSIAVMALAGILTNLFGFAEKASLGGFDLRFFGFFYPIFSSIILGNLFGARFIWKLYNNV